MIDLIRIIIQARKAFPNWRRRVAHCRKHGKENKEAGSCYYTEEDKLFVVPSMTFVGFIGEETEWYFFKKNEKQNG